MRSTSLLLARSEYAASFASERKILEREGVLRELQAFPRLPTGCFFDSTRVALKCPHVGS